MSVYLIYKIGFVTGQVYLNFSIFTPTPTIYCKYERQAELIIRTRACWFWIVKQKQKSRMWLFC